MVPQCGHDEVGALERRHAGRDRVRLLVERGMREGKVPVVPREARRRAEKVERPCPRAWLRRRAGRGGGALLEELENSGLLPGELRTCWWGYEQLWRDGEHRGILERRQLAQFLRRESRLERATPSDNGYVANGGMAEDVEDRGGDVVLFEDARGREQHPCDVERDVALADDGHMLRFV